MLEESRVGGKGGGERNKGGRRRRESRSGEGREEGERDEWGRGGRGGETLGSWVGIPDLPLHSPVYQLSHQ